MWFNRAGTGQEPAAPLRMNQIEQYGTDGEDYAEPGHGITATAVVTFLRAYAGPVLLAVLTAAIGYLLFAVIYLLMQPVARHATLGFRLEFPGAENGKYPNGVTFRGRDIVDTPVLRAVYDANGLQRYIGFAQFSRSLVVLESNAVVYQLAREYEAKLADPKLSSVERDRIEAEYNQKRESLSKNDYALTWSMTEGTRRVPPTVTAKTLSDILSTWADFASRTRQVLLHRVPLVSTQALARLAANDQDLLSSLLALRTSAREMQENLRQLAALPGAEVVRSSSRQASLEELRLELAMLESTGIEYLINETLGGIQDRRRAIAVVRAQLEYDQRALLSAEERARVAREALEVYTRPQIEDRAVALNSANEPTDAGPQAAPQTLILNDSFLDRVVALSQNAVDREYRQRKVEEIRAAATETVPLRSAVAYDEALLDRLSSPAPSSMTSDQLATARNRVAAQLGNVAKDLVDIRHTLSRSLNSSAQLYTITSPAVTLAERSVDIRRLGLGGIAAVLIVAILALLLAFLHYRLALERSRQNEGGTEPER